MCCPEALIVAIPREMPLSGVEQGFVVCTTCKFETQLTRHCMTSSLPRSATIRKNCSDAPPCQHSRTLGKPRPGVVRSRSALKTQIQMTTETKGPRGRPTHWTPRQPHLPVRRTEASADPCHQSEITKSQTTAEEQMPCRSRIETKQALECLLLHHQLG
jgi:hypothetical protein